jgi:hypothetical protein
MSQRLFRTVLAALLLPVASARAQETASTYGRPDKSVVIAAAGVVRPPAGKVPGAAPAPLPLDDILRLLQGTIDTQELQSDMKLDQALARLSGLCKAQGKELVFVVDREAFVEENPDAPEMLEAGVKLPAYPGRMRLGDALRFALARVPTNNATFLVRRGAIEITTDERAALPNLLSRKVTVRLQRVTLAEALHALAEESGVSVVVDVRVAEKTRAVVTLNLANEGVWNAMYAVLNMGGLRAVAVGNYLYVTSPENAARLHREVAGWSQAR